MIEKIRAYVKKYHMLEQSDIVIAGISGGADSVCLLFVLMELQKEIGFQIRTVHVHHGLRGKAADADAAFVKKLTEQYKIPCTIYYYDVELEAKKRKQSTEEAGREVRREAFQKERDLYGGTKIALAHHSDDNAETFLMNLIRGSRLQGLGGMRPVSDSMIRPLLCVGRKEIEMYLEERQISYCTDATNFENIYTRNKLRNCVIPYLEEEINPAAVAHINQTMEQLRQISDYMNTQVEKAFDDYVKIEGEEVMIRIAAKSALAEVIFHMLCHRVIAEAAGSEKNIGQKHVELLSSMWDQQKGSKLSLPYRLTAVHEEACICIKKMEEKNQRERKGETDSKEASYPIVPGMQLRIENSVITAKLIEKSSSDAVNVPDNIYTKWFDYDIIKDTVIVRKRRPGDYIIIDKSGKKQKLKSYFINEKIPKEERDRIWLVAQGSHVLWIAGYRRGCAAYVLEETERILEITIHGGEKDVRNN